MLRKYPDILVILVWTTISIVPIAMNIQGLGRALIVLPLVLFFPGYALSTVISPDQVRGTTERIAYAIGLSLGISVLTGFALNLTSWGLRGTAWSLVLVAVTIVGSLIALIRRVKADKPVAVATPLVMPSLLHVAALGTAALIGFTALLLAQTSVAQTQQPFTQFWALPDQNNTVRVGVQNLEQQSASYTLTMKNDDRVLYELKLDALPSGKTWEQPLPIPQDTLGKVEAFLYRTDAPTIQYRHVSFWLTPVPSK